MAGDSGFAVMRWYGHDQADKVFRTAFDGGTLHHGWILAGPRGIGKASFALKMAHLLLGGANAQQTAALIKAGSHPDLKTLKRLPKDTVKAEFGDIIPEQDLKRNISVDQIRTLGPLLSSKPSMGQLRIIIIDSIDDLERSAANALLKNLEEPPQGTIFLCVSHAPGRLLPTILSRCQMLRFEPLDDTDMRSAIRDVRSDIPPDELEMLLIAGQGAPGYALEFAGLGLAELDEAMRTISASGDPANKMRHSLAAKLSLKAAHARYEAFLRRVPAFIAQSAQTMPLGSTPTFVNAYEEASHLASRAVRLNTDKSAAVLEMGRILASLAKAEKLRAD